MIHSPSHAAPPDARRFSTGLLSPAWIGIAVVVLVVSTGDSDDARPTDGRDRSRVPGTMAAQRFAVIFFGGPGPEHVASTENRLDEILRQKIVALNFVCEL